MSNRQELAALRYNRKAPRFSQAVVGLHETYAACAGRVTSELILEVAALVKGFRYRFGNDTLEDGYSPLCGLSFAAQGGGIVAIIFPWFQDHKMNDGTSTDRSVSAHSIGASDEEVDRVADALRNAFRTTILDLDQVTDIRKVSVT